VNLTEAEINGLVERARAGDEAASNSLLAGLRAQMLRWAVVVTGDVDEAEDVTQQVSMTLHRKLGSFQSKSRFTTWVYTIVRNTAIEAKRKSGRRATVELDDDVVNQLSSSMEDHIDRMSNERMATTVRAFFGELPPRQRQLIELIDQRGCTPAEAAEIMEIEPETARVHLLRARRALRARMLGVTE
jgi:RNA polymerase sigma-70 factor, ECF subfamily